MRRRKFYVSRTVICSEWVEVIAKNAEEAEDMVYHHEGTDDVWDTVTKKPKAKIRRLK